jgi:hypothetical protein
MMRRIHLVTILMLALLVASTATAGLLSKSFEYREDVTLEIAKASGEGLRLDGVHFHGNSSPLRADVAISNISSGPLKAGVAIALFDADGRLVGVASAGTQFIPVRAGRQKSYSLIFNHVNGEASKAKSFQISLETTGW